MSACLSRLIEAAESLVPLKEYRATQVHLVERLLKTFHITIDAFLFNDMLISGPVSCNLAVNLLQSADLS